MESHTLHPGRRAFLQRIGVGAAGLALGAAASPKKANALLGFGSDKSKVALVSTSDHRVAAYEALAPFKNDVAEAIGDKQVIIKVNAGMALPEYARNSTKADHIRGILDFLKPIHDRRIIIMEGTAGAMTSAFVGFENYGYMPLEKEYNVKLADANDMPYSQQFIRAAKYHPTAINIINNFFDPNVYLISAALMKAHNAVVATYSLKNVAMGSPVCHYKDKVNEKSKMHGGDGSSGGRELSWNLFHLAELGVRPDLAVIDGVQTIEGNGPWGGEDVQHNIGVASTDFVAADRLCTELMGIDPRWMKYLEWCGDAGWGNFNLDKIDVDGPNYKNYIRKYKLHNTVDEQVAWIYENYDM